MDKKHQKELWNEIENYNHIDTNRDIPLTLLEYFFRNKAHLLISSRDSLNNKDERRKKMDRRRMELAVKIEMKSWDLGSEESIRNHIVDYLIERDKQSKEFRLEQRLESFDELIEINNLYKLADNSVEDDLFAIIRGTLGKYGKIDKVYRSNPGKWEEYVTRVRYHLPVGTYLAENVDHQSEIDIETIDSVMDDRFGIIDPDIVESIRFFHTDKDKKEFTIKEGQCLVVSGKLIIQKVK